MSKSFWLLNLLLVVLALALGWGLLQALGDLQTGHTVSPPGANDLRAATAIALPKETPQPPRVVVSPPLGDFDTIVTKGTFTNPFATAQPATGSAALGAARAEPPPVPLPPLPTLVGTIFLGEERKAVLADNARTEIYKHGQPVAGGKIVAIEADHVTIERRGGNEVVYLKARLQSAAPAGTRPVPATLLQPGAALPAAAPATPPTAVAPVAGPAPERAAPTAPADMVAPSATPTPGADPPVSHTPWHGNPRRAPK